MRDSDLFTAAELALLGSPRPIALKVSPVGELGVVEVTAGVVTEVVGGPHVDTVPGGEGIGLLVQRGRSASPPSEQDGHAVAAGLREGVPARRATSRRPWRLWHLTDAAGGPAGLTKPQIRLLGGGRLSPRARWILQRRANRDGRRRRRVWGRARDSGYRRAAEPNTGRETVNAAACTHHQPSLSLVVDQFLGFGHPRLSTRQQLITANLRPMTH